MCALYIFSYCLFNDDITTSDYTASNSRIMNSKCLVIGKSLEVSTGVITWGAVLAFAYRDLRKSRRTSERTVGVPTEIRNWYVWNIRPNVAPCVCVCNVCMCVYRMYAFLKGFMGQNVVTCGGGTRDENNGFWIGWLDLLAFRLQVLLITINYNAVAILTTFSSPLHTHYDSPGIGSQHRNYS
jgi:hypothetical protein